MKTSAKTIMRGIQKRKALHRRTMRPRDRARRGSNALLLCGPCHMLARYTSIRTAVLSPISGTMALLLCRAMIARSLNSAPPVRRRPRKNNRAFCGRFDSGAPAILSNASPVLLESTEPSTPDPEAEHSSPAEGRQLLSFTDSRQGTARFSAKLQNAAERNHVRALIYFASQELLACRSGECGQTG